MFQHIGKVKTAKGQLVTFVTISAMLVGVLGGAALTASNTIPNSNAGDGAGSVSGYTISSKNFILNNNDPTKIDGVRFDISPENASSVKAQFVSNGTFYNCDNDSGSVSCDTTNPVLTVAGANTLRVLAVE